MIDFSPLHNREVKPMEFVKDLTVDDLRNVTNESVDTLLGFLENLTDAHVTFDPVDPNADDPYAVEGEEHIGWNMAHLLAHVTASSEEGAAFSSVLARGYAQEERPRYEIPWQDITTVAQCRQRLEESRRIRLAYLDTWPDEPFLDVYRKGISERFQEIIGNLNAPASFIFGLSHELGHYDQIREVREQAIKAFPLEAQV